ncbi:2-amino-4-hydroxy-6-hydroxymethyldihydropteridine diphosphokinase [Desulfotalea psychrophila]|uniref:2-amino-4-hydroxy-6-hydroxymethyldihydropteridine pyrophosphokinase n=1 Tax=Desulfotalea psychrophila TaxID=84980 RepID=A0ABS3AU91_9BACT|nr:2-amino-4-hydroxy-6-hydroxymethyldihydropteridine diphosphokinase [Desulfotalea psychrophila]
MALGSNLGDSHRILQQAWHDLGEDKEIKLIILSRPYVTEPVGMESENLFLNAVGILETNHTPEQLLALLQQVEKGFGRIRKTGQNGYRDRLLDLDILYYDDCVLTTEELLVPHPHRAERLFVLAPLVEIDPLHCDPCSGQTAVAMHQKLLQQMKDGKEAFQAIKAETWG